MTTESKLSPGGWKVESQSSGYQRASNGTVVKGTNVHFTTSAGVVSTVFVPDATFIPGKIRTMISNKVVMLDAVSSMSTPGK